MLAQTPALARKTRPSLQAVALVSAVALTAGVGCIPVIPVCDCQADGDTVGIGDYPDFAHLDRDGECADIPLPSEGGGDTGTGDTGTEDTGTEDTGTEDTGTDTETDEGGICGYPEGPYGFEEGGVFPNLELLDCAGNPVQIAQYLPQEGNDVETRGIVFGVGAAWCMPCAEEAHEWAELFVDDYAGEVQFLQALDQDGSGSGAPNEAICAGWSTANADDKFPILYTTDQGSLQASIGGQPAQPIPFTLVLDANANIVFKQTGAVVDAGVLEVQLTQIVNDPYGN